MRTYSRKRPEYKELENVTELCRLCLERHDEGVPIYAGDDFILYSPLALRIMLCVGFEMAKDDSISNWICTKCHSEIERYYSFRKKCELSYLKLKSHKQAVKAKESKEKLSEMSDVNLGGSEQLQDSINGVLDEEEPIVRLTKILNDEGKISNLEVLQILNKTNLNNTASVQNTVPVDSHRIRVEDFQAETKPEPPSLIPVAKPAQSKVQEVSLSEARPSDPDFTEFLSTMLTELGVLTQHGDGVVTLDPSMCRTLELETRDGNNITFELVEEDDKEIEVMETYQECPAQNINSMKTYNSEISDPLSRARSIAGRRAAACAQCGRVLADRSVLARHVRNVHARARPHECPACGKCFAQKEVMKRHLLVHKDKRPFACDQCSKSFTQRASLNAHKLAHRTERALTLHPCPQCSKIFFYASGLSRHLIQHSNKQIECGECKRTFSDKSSLRRHERNMRHSSICADNTTREDKTTTSTCITTVVANTMDTITTTTTNSADTG